MVLRSTSTREVKKVEDLISNKRYLLPQSYANERSTSTGKSIIYICVNAVKYEIPVCEEVDIPYQVYCVLKDSAVYRDLDNYDLGKEFDPFEV